LFTPPTAVFVEVVKGRTLRKFELDADATAYRRFSRKGRGGTTFLAERVGGYLNSDLRPTMPKPRTFGVCVVSLE
jgi:hypothetical protein